MYEYLCQDWIMNGFRLHFPCPFHVATISLFFYTVYNDQPISSKSPPTRDKIHPEVKAQARIRSRNRGQDAVDAGRSSQKEKRKNRNQI